MPDYGKGVIYSIRSPSTEEEYIGSTCRPLSLRFAKHKSDYKRWLKGSADFRASYHIVKYPDAYIVPLLEFPCQRVEELTAKEYELIKERKCVNRMGRKDYKPPPPTEPTILDSLFRVVKQPESLDGC